MHFQKHTPRAFLFAFTVFLAAACGPEQPHGGHGGHFFGMRHGLGLATRAVRLGAREMRPRGFRRACADDVTRLCSASRTRRDERDCLEGKQNSLSAACKAALNHRRIE